MATPANDTYTVPAGQPINAGRSVSVAAPDATGGTVSQLLADWSGTGFQLLTTLPGLPTYDASGHAGSAWDEARQRLWIFGAETHGTAQTRNAMYCWDAKDGLIKRQYAPDPCPGAYHISADGFLYADAANSRPWGMHAFRTLWFDTATKEVGVAYDAYDHAMWIPPYDAPAIDIESRKCPFWYYNTVTGKWRKQDSPAITAYNRAGTGTASTRVPGDGWYRVNDAYIWHLSEDGTTRTVGNYSGKVPPLIQHFAHLVGRNIVQIGGYYDTPGSFLGSIHPLDDLAASRVLMVSAFPALAGWDVSNCWSAPMPDGRIVFGAQQAGTGSIGAFILDWNKTAPTVTDTGHRLGITTSRTVDHYELKAAWSATHNCAIFITNRMGAGEKVFGLRI